MKRPRDRPWGRSFGEDEYKCEPQPLATRLLLIGDHLLVWTTAVCLMLVLLRGVDILFLKRLETQELFPLGELGINLAAASAVAVWATLTSAI